MRRVLLAVLLASVAVSGAWADPTWKVERDRARYRMRTASARFKFPPNAGEWQISHPPAWEVKEDPKNPDTYVFMAPGGVVRLLLTRRVLSPKVQGAAIELEDRNLEVARKLGQQMATLAAEPPKFKEFHNITCHGLFYQLTAAKPRPGDLPFVVGISAVKDRYHLVGYFQFSSQTGEVAQLIRAMIDSISFGDPPR